MMKQNYKSGVYITYTEKIKRKYKLYLCRSD